jgi:hypothetical protein
LPGGLCPGTGPWIKKGAAMSNKKSRRFFFLFIFYIFSVPPVVLPIISLRKELMPLAALITLFPAVCLFLCWILAVQYNRHSKPVNERIEAIIHEKPPLFPPQSVLAAYKEIKAAGKRIALIRTGMTKTADYLALLSRGKNDDKTKDMIEKQYEYYNYFFNYYDKYCSLYLDMRFQFYMTTLRDVVLARGKLSGIDIKRFINTIKADITCMGYVLKNKHNLPGYSRNNDSLSQYSANKFAAVVEEFEIITDIEGTIAIFFTDENTKKEAKRRPAGKGENREKYNTVFEKTNAAIKAVNGKIQEAAAHLVTLQSNAIIGGASPIDEENALNLQMRENSFTTILEYSKTLDDEYDRFMAEVEVTSNN